MDGAERRKQILELLDGAATPLSGTQLARHFGVSRQVIVQDIALLKSRTPSILSTHRGYILQRPGTLAERVFWVRHTNAQIEDELNTIVDYGGKIRNVVVEHEVYGMITVDLVLNSRKNVRDFVERLEQAQAKPLKDIAIDGEHGHLVLAETKAELDQIGTALQAKGYLV